jgi:hypothetical protein
MHSSKGFIATEMKQGNGTNGQRKREGRRCLLLHVQLVPSWPYWQRRAGWKTARCTPSDRSQSEQNHGQIWTTQRARGGWLRRSFHATSSTSSNKSTNGADQALPRNSYPLINTVLVGFLPAQSTAILENNLQNNYPLRSFSSN